MLKRHWSHVGKIEAWSDVFDAAYLSRLESFSPEQVEARVAAHLERIIQQLKKAGQIRPPEKDTNDEQNVRSAV